MTEPPKQCTHIEPDWPHNPAWKVIECKNGRDICECRLCGEKHEHACNFDDGDFS